jgi:hypothetical protein
VPADFCHREAAPLVTNSPLLGGEHALGIGRGREAGEAAWVSLISFILQPTHG